MLALLLVAFLGLDWRGFDPWVRSWPNIDRQFWLATRLLAPTAVGMAVWIASHHRRAETVDLHGATPTELPVQRVLGWLAAAMACLLAYGLAVAFIVWKGMAAGFWGSPSLAVIAVGAASILAATALGFAAGTWIPVSAVRFVAPALGFLVFMLIGNHVLTERGLVIPGTGMGGPDNYGALFTLQDRLANTRFYPAFWPSLALFSGMFAGGMSVLARPAHRGPGKHLMMCSMLSVLLVVGGSTALATMPQGDYIGAEPSPGELACEDRGIPVCVHPAWAHHLDAWADQAARIAAPVVGLPGSPEHLVQEIGSRPGDVSEVTGLSETGMTQPVISETDALIGETIGHDRGSITWGIARGLVTTPDQLGGLNEAQEIVAAWLVLQSGLAGDDEGPLGWLALPGDPEHAFVAAMRQFVDLDPAVRSAWLALHYEALRQGTIALEDLP